MGLHRAHTLFSLLASEHEGPFSEGVAKEITRVDSLQSTKGGFGGGGSVRRNSFGEARPSAPSAAKRFAKVTPQEFAARRWIDAFQVRARRPGPVMLS